jgi:hypothetical protein
LLGHLTVFETEAADLIDYLNLGHGV